MSQAYQDVSGRVTLSTNGDLVAYDSTTGKPIALHAPANGAWLQADSATAGGYKALTWAMRTAWVTPPGYEVDLSASVSTRYRTGLANGANTITLSNPTDGVPYLYKIVQPSSGAAGTLTFVCSGYTVKGDLSLLSTVNSAINFVTLVFEAPTMTLYVSLHGEAY